MLFGAFKRAGKYHLPFDDLTSIFRFISRLCMDFKRTLTPAKIWVGFGGVVIEFERTFVPY
jgi:hypothetical protein